ncbi:hypothetical protein MTO96_026660 [Rhipicephalus appendiculatus]
MGRNFTIQKALDLAREEERVDRALLHFSSLQALNWSRRRCLSTSSRWRRQGVYCECLCSGVVVGSHGNALSLRLVAALGRLCCLPRQEPYLFAVRKARTLRESLPLYAGVVGCSSRHGDGDQYSNRPSSGQCGHHNWATSSSHSDQRIHLQHVN